MDLPTETTSDSIRKKKETTSDSCCPGGGDGFHITSKY
jgi:hypothetical protein